MSAPVASASMSVPAVASAAAAKPVGGESPEELFGAFFATFESTTGDDVQAYETPPRAGNHPSPLQDSNVAPAQLPTGQGAWIAQIDKPGASAQTREGAAAAVLSNNAPSAAKRQAESDRSSLDF